MIIAIIDHRKVEHSRSLFSCRGGCGSELAWPGPRGDRVSKRLIAVVEDDESFRRALVVSLTSLGYSARGFASAEHFVAEDGDKSCDCVITDIHMPAMSGFDLKRLLTSRGFTKPVIMITAQKEPALETRAMACGAICLLRKPFDDDALIDFIERALEI
jgi:FixJ family two-component response regulator